MSRNDAGADRARILRLGAWLAILGAIGYLTGLLWHRDLPDETIEIALNHIAQRREWQFIHLLSMIAVLLWLGAFIALTQTLSGAMSRFVGRLAVYALTVGVTVFIVDYSIDGYRLKHVADAWAVAEGAHQAEHRLVAEALFGVLGGTFRSFIAWMYGLPFLLLGIAIVNDREYPRWVGWVPIGAGLGAVVAGTTLFLDIDLVPFPVLFAGFVIPLNLWLGLLGVLMWRNAASAVAPRS
jgi:hypothetical protein